MGHYRTYLLRGVSRLLMSAPCSQLLVQPRPVATSTTPLSGTNRWRAWYFPVDVSGTVAKVCWGILRNSDAGRQFTFYAWAHNVTEPGALLATSEAVLSADLPATAGYLEVPLALTVTAGTPIWLGVSYNLASMSGAAAVSLLPSTPVGFNRGLVGSSTAGPWWNATSNQPAWCQAWS